MTLIVPHDPIHSERYQQQSNTKAPADPKEESVYRLIPKNPPPPPKPPLYRSIFADQARAEYKQGVKQSASMGPAKVAIQSPKQFLQKHAKEGHLPQPKQFHYKDQSKRPSVPKHTDQAKLNPPPKKQFVKANAIQVIESTPGKIPVPPVKYILKSDYGRKPDYLAHRQEEMKRRQQEQQELALKRQEEEDKQFQLVSEPERLKILAGLTDKWEKLNIDYQKLSLTVDTVPKINRKVSMENQLKQLEQDIEKLSQHNLYIKIDQ